MPAKAVEIVASVAQHRALSAAQIRAIHLPQSRERWTQRVLARLGEAGLLAYAQTTGVPQRLWFATEAGVRFAREAGVLRETPRLFSAAEVAGPLQAHTVAVNDAALCFLTAARERGDDFGPFAWRHEVAHLHSRRGQARRVLFADAVLTYLRLTEDEVVIEQRFLELDRATLSVDRLANELARYAELFRAAGSDGEPLWRALYPSFPAVLCVLAGSTGAALERRRNTVLALMRADPRLTLAPEVQIRLCLLEELRERGPFAPIFAELRRPGAATNWLGHPGSDFAEKL